MFFLLTESQLELAEVLHIHYIDHLEREQHVFFMP